MQTLYSLSKQAMDWDHRPPRQRYPSPQPEAQNVHLIEQAAQQLYGVCKLIDQIVRCPGNRVQNVRMMPIDQFRELLRNSATEMMGQARLESSPHDPGEFSHSNWPHQDDAPYGKRRGEGTAVAY